MSRRKDIGHLKPPASGVVRHVDRLKQHPLVFALMALGAVASIVALVLYLFPAGKPRFSGGAKGLSVEQVTTATRSPLWDNSYLGKDEVVANVRGRFDGYSREARQLAIVAFWRLANAYETNWHVGKRRVGASYKIALLDGEIASQESWDFLVGGIETDKSYDGPVSILVAAFRRDEVDAREREWLNDELGWGFEQLPTKGRVAITSPRLFETHPVR
jgi:hypothetical protein